MNDNRKRFVGAGDDLNLYMISEIINSELPDCRKVWLLNRYMLNWLTIDEVNLYL